MTDDELIVTQEAVDAIAGAYEQAAGEFRALAGHFGQSYSRDPWGQFSSIRQLQHGYEQLAVGENDSAVARLHEFADTAHGYAKWIRAGMTGLAEADHSGAHAVAAAGQV